MKLKLTHLRNAYLLSFPILLLFVLAFPMVMSIQHFKPITLILFLVPATILVAPALWIHYTYYIKTKSTIFTIDEGGILVEDGTGKTIYPVQEIKEIRFNMTKARIVGISRTFLHQGYYFCRVMMKDGEEVVITSLHSNNLDEIFAKTYKQIPKIVICDFFPVLSGTIIEKSAT